MKGIEIDEKNFECVLNVLENYCGDLYYSYFNRRCRTLIGGETVDCNKCMFRNKEFIRGWLMSSVVKRKEE